MEMKMKTMQAMLMPESQHDAFYAHNMAFATAL